MPGRVASTRSSKRASQSQSQSQTQGQSRRKEVLLFADVVMAQSKEREVTLSRVTVRVLLRTPIPATCHVSTRLVQMARAAPVQSSVSRVVETSELIQAIFRNLTLKELKSTILLSKRCFEISADILWEEVKDFRRLLNIFHPLEDRVTRPSKVAEVL